MVVVVVALVVVVVVVVVAVVVVVVAVVVKIVAHNTSWLLFSIASLISTYKILKNNYLKRLGLGSTLFAFSSDFYKT